MIRIGHIDYINMIPFELEETADQSYCNIKGPPTQINQMLLKGEVDMGMISTAFFLENKAKLLRIGDYGIVSDGPVMSVMLFSRKDLSSYGKKGPLRLYETPESATSVILNRIILRQTYGLSHLIPSTRSEADAILLIGNKALLEREKEPWDYRYDLGAEWKKLTGLPAVFAVLAANIKIFNEKKEELEVIIELLRNKLSKSLNDIYSIVQIAQERLPMERKLLHRYFQGLTYVIGRKEKRSIALFEQLKTGDPDFGVRMQFKTD